MDCGDFPIYILKHDLSYTKTSSYALFPNGFTTSKTELEPSSSKDQMELGVAKGLGANAPWPLPATNRVKEWTCSQVSSWLMEELGLETYAASFAKAGVDGRTLLLLQDDDLQQLLNVHHAIHRKSILNGIDALQDKELLYHGVNYDQLADYIQVLDRDRITVSDIVLKFAYFNIIYLKFLLTLS